MTAVNNFLGASNRIVSIIYLMDRVGSDFVWRMKEKDTYLYK